MATIRNYDEFIGLQTRYPRDLSNDFMMPSEIKARFDNGAITAFADEMSLMIYERREGFSKLHFRLADISARVPPHDGTLAAFLVYREDRPPGVAAAWLIDQGFERQYSLTRHTATEIIGAPSSEGVVTASAGEVYALVSRYFSAAGADMPCRDLFEAERSYCVRSDNGIALGVMYDMGQTRIVAVSREARGKGVGRRLCLAYAAVKLCENKNHVFQEWIRPDNSASLAMYNSLGYLPEKIVSDCYTREG